MTDPTAQAVIRAQKGKRKEGDLQSAILKYLQARGILAWRMNSRVVMMPGRGGKMRPVRFGGIKGMADIIGVQSLRVTVGDTTGPVHFPVRIGRFIALEVKRPGEQPTIEQRMFLAGVEKAGGLALVCHELADVARALGEQPKTTHRGAIMTTQYRQGDVFIERVKALPKALAQRARDKGRIVLAYGEVTGHAHALDESLAELFEDKAGVLYLKLGETGHVRHEEHGAITLEPGVYRVTHQREYSPEAIRRVAD